LVVDTWTDTERGMEVNVEAIVVCECIWFIGRVGERRVGLVNSVKNGGVGAKMVDERWLLITSWMKVLFERSDRVLRCLGKVVNIN